MHRVEFSYGYQTAFSDGIVPVIKNWQNRPLKNTYVIIWLDTVHFNVRHNGLIQNRVIYSVLAITPDGKMEVIGVYFADDESSLYWQQVLNDLKRRGVKKICIACIDNVKGFNTTIKKIFPGTKVQLCLAHLLRNSVKYLAWKDIKPFVNDLKKIFTAKNATLALTCFEVTEEKWNNEYAVIFKTWRNNWASIIALYQYPPALRKIIYSTYPIESYHRMIKRVTSTRGEFCFESTIVKKIYSEAVKGCTKWHGTIFNWGLVQNDLSEYFGEMEACL
ncbi:MAG: family transposase [Mucilaginibacter sp.]|nr:family transposase [Mucilaginibacter sp.]